MMYNNKLAIALKSAGKVLREFKDTVYVPFGSEYSILIKNLNNVRATVKVTVDGIDVGDGTSFVVNPNDDINIERFIKNGNLDGGNRLKFIERTKQIEDHKGIGIEDGLIRVEFNFERQLKQLSTFSSSTVTFPPGIRTPGDWYVGVGSVQHDTNALYSTQSITHSTPTQQNNDTGITVPGSISDQEFKTADWFPTESETHVLVLSIKGQTLDNTLIEKPVTVKTKPKCVTCGRTNKATAKFCSECGTSTQIG
jgi:hypothetical protein